MSTKRFGPTLGAGVALEEQDAGKVLEAATLGVTAYAGILERGDTGKLISTFSKKDFARKCGGRIADSNLPLVAQHFWDHSNGAGELHLIRVTDGTEVAASRVMYDRSAPMNRVLKVAAKNGGRWGGKRAALVGAVASSASINQTSLTTGIATMKKDQWKGATLKLDAVANKSYVVTGNLPDGTINIAADATMKTDFGAGVDLGWSLELARDTAHEVCVMFDDGDVDQVNLFSMSVYVNGLFVRRYPNLSMDPTSAYYVVNMVNNDDSNNEIAVTDLNTPNSVSPAKRPVNDAGVVKTVTTGAITFDPINVKVTSPTGANPTVALGTLTSAMQYRDRLVVTMTSLTAFTVTSTDVGGGSTMGTGTVGTPFTPTSPLLPPFTITQGGTVLASGDVINIDYLPLQPSALKGGMLVPDTTAPLKKVRITDNAVNSISIGVGDLTTMTSIGKNFTASWAQPLTGGYDGLATVGDANYTAAFDIATSKFRDLVGQNKGLVKVAAPGNTSTVVQQAGIAFAEAMNWQFRVEIPDTTTTEDGAINYINGTIGRSDNAVTVLPSFADIPNPDKSGQLLRVSMTGMIHGREALVAKNYDGFHKAAAGVDVKLPLVAQLPATGLNEEALNPQGINVVKKNKGNFVIWGDRTISIDPAWKFKHQREQMSHYENTLRESFDWIVFAINDPIEQQQAVTALKEFFRPELPKRALKGKTLDDAVSIKVDGDINTAATEANGDMFAEISLALADTVERFIMRVSKAGIFDQVQ